MPKDKRGNAAPGTRGTILAGAGRAFGRLGYGACRVEDIIESAGVSRATFYKFFDSKERVFDAIEEAFEFSFIHAMQSVDDPRLSPSERAEEYLDTYLRWMVGWREVARVMWTDPTRPRAGSVPEARNAAFRGFVDLIAELTTGMGAPTADPLVYRGLLGAIGEIGLAVVESPRTSDADLLRARRAIIRIVAATLTASDPD